MSGSQPNQPPPNLPNDRQASMAAGARRIVLTPFQRKMAIGGAAVCAFGLVAYIGNSLMNDKGVQRKAAELDTNQIRQVVKPVSLPADEQVDKEDAPTLVRIVADNGHKKKEEQHDRPPPTVKNEPEFVSYPASFGETLFDVSARDVKPDAAGAEVPGKEPGKTTVAFKASTLPGIKAGPALDMTYRMGPQRIPCTLDTAIDTTVAGDFACHTDKDVLSPMNVPLMVAGTQIQGTFKGGVKVGESRIDAMAVTALTPEGIPVALDSGMGDGMGRTGINGEVENHTMERYGAAIGLTALQTSLGFGRDLLTRGSGGNSILNFNSGGQSSAPDIATEILRRQAEIRPTIYVPAGQTVTIITRQIVDFSDAIKVRKRER